MKDIESRLKELPAVTDEAFKDIKATEGLRYRIQEAAAAEKAPASGGILRVSRLIPVLSCALVLAVALGVGIPALTGKPQSAEEPQLMLASEPGQVRFLVAEEVMDTAPSADHEEQAVDALYNLTVMAAGVPLPENAAKVGDIGNGSLTVQEQKLSYSVLVLDQAAYRLVESVSSVPASCLGGVCATVGELTADPVNASGNRSNAVQTGESVYSVNGMEGICVAARVDGAMRLFQRCSLSGKAAGRDLKSVLALDHVASISLKGVGTVSGANAQALADTLRDTAYYLSGSCAESRKVLLITYENGLSLQMFVNGDDLSFCGTWSAPEFMEQFTALAK